MDYAYLIRYGLMRRVGRFVSESGGLERGQTVVIRTHRGTELGEVLLEVPTGSAFAAAVGSSLVVRPACPEDLALAARVGDERSRRFALCRQVFEDGEWPIALIDAEPLLDDRRTVLHYLGPHSLDFAGLRAVLQGSCGLDVVLEPVGCDEPAWLEDADASAPESHACGSCSSEREGGCGAGGCGSTEGAHGGGCSDCGVKKLLGTRRVTAAP